MTPKKPKPIVKIETKPSNDKHTKIKPDPNNSISTYHSYVTNTYFHIYEHDEDGVDVQMDILNAVMYLNEGVTMQGVC